MTGRLERERDFHDEAYADSKRTRVAKYYSANAAGEAAYGHALLAAAPGGRRVLEYGCGQGSAAFELAARGNDVHGIDISPVAIEQARQQAVDAGVDGHTTFDVMNAEHLLFDDHSFDVVCGSGILHHLDIPAAAAEVGRVLRPGGTAVFIEPLGHNALIRLYRRLTPDLRTPDEHPLLVGDLEELRRSFADVRLTYTTLTTLAAVPLSGRRGFPSVLSALERLDRALLSVPRLSRYAWCCVIELRTPQASPPQLTSAPTSSGAHAPSQ